MEIREQGRKSLIMTGLLFQIFKASHAISALEQGNKNNYGYFFFKLDISCAPYLRSSRYGGDILRTLKIKPRAHGDMGNHETHIDRLHTQDRRYLDL